MPVKSMVANGRTVHFGRKRPVVRHQRLKMKNYMAAVEPIVPPATCNYSAAAADALAQMYGNDTLGDCVCAAVAHLVGVFTGNAANPAGGLVLPESEIVSLYSAACGYVPGNPNTDQGCDIQTVLQYWENKGATAAHKIVGIMDVDPTNLAEVQAAIYLFENLILGMDLPDKWVTPMPSTNGFLWDVAGAHDPENGHCIAAFGYNNLDIAVSTWGMTGFLSNTALAKYCAASNDGELYVVLSQDVLANAQATAPNGLDWAQLQADFAAIGGVTPVPPTPVPPPAPPPPSPPVPVPPIPVRPPVPPAPPPPAPPSPKPVPPAPVRPPAPVSPVPTPVRSGVVETAAWFRSNLSSEAFQELQQAFEAIVGKHQFRD